MKEHMEIGEFLRSLRGKMSLREAAEKSGLSHSYINSLEKGEHPKTKAPIKPTPDTLERLSAAYDYSYEELMAKAGYIKEEVVHESPAEYHLSDQRKKLLDMYDKLPKGRQEVLDKLAEEMLKELGLVPPGKKNESH